MEEAVIATGRSAPELRLAGAFFVEQVLMNSSADDWRVLGSNAGTPLATVKERRQLLLRWLHPDKAKSQVESGSVDRSAFASRVTAAWNRLSTNTVVAASSATLQPVARLNSVPGGRGTKSVSKVQDPRQSVVERLRRFLYGHGQ
jgi:hypothetical protein